MTSRLFVRNLTVRITRVLFLKLFQFRLFRGDFRRCRIKGDLLHDLIHGHSQVVEVFFKILDITYMDELEKIIWGLTVLLIYRLFKLKQLTEFLSEFVWFFKVEIFGFFFTVLADRTSLCLPSLHLIFFLFQFLKLLSCDRFSLLIFTC